MKQLSSLEIRYLIKELQFLINSRVDNIYQPDKKELLLHFYVPNKGRQILKITAGRMFYLTIAKESYGKPSQFCMFLRKHLNNARLKEIQQKESERIVEFIFDAKEKKKLIIEFFGGGNIVLCDKEDIILSASEYHKWKDREITPKSRYIYPNKGCNIFNLKLDGIKNLLKSSKKDSLVTCLAVEFGLGGTYAEEVCLLSNLDKSAKPASIGLNAAKKILESIGKIVNNKTRAVIYYENKEVKEIAPLELTIYKGLEMSEMQSISEHAQKPMVFDKKEFKNYNEALGYYFTCEYKPEKRDTKYEKEIKKLKSIIEQQKDKIKELGEEMEENKKKAEAVYNNYGLIKSIISDINNAAKKYSWGQIKEKLEGNRLIKDVDVKEKKVIMELS